eukprot:TRINITY_DN3153_c0_g1_i1.p1 TRINITY_DN3153_c0_g1~~TRINITY_DN3153_c0_g1_i1.p1  ORF type:complete len:494 (-),score=154.11 TRINITY_DN3153_c0_g1_i1:34-1515(-)
MIETLKRENNNDGEIWDGLDLGMMGLVSLSPKIGIYTHLTALYVQGNNLTKLPGDLFNQLKNLTSLDISNNKLNKLPNEMGKLINLKEFNIKKNLIQQLPYEVFGKLLKLKTLLWEGNPIKDPPMQVMQQGIDNIVQYCRDSISFNELNVYSRELTLLENEEEYAKKGYRKVTTVCFNILAEIYATSEKHPYCPRWALDWEYRKDRILEEIEYASSDIICLQEVETSQYFDFFKKKLEGEFDGCFKPKSRAKTTGKKDKVDGCAIFYRKSVFNKVEEIIIEFQEIAENKFGTGKGTSGLHRLLLKDNIAVVLILEFKDTKQRMIVANTHIHWNPEFSDVKLVQTQIFIEELTKIREKCKSVTKVDPPMIVCGDFNSTPDSGVYELLTQGHIGASHPELLNFNYGEYSKNGMNHKLPLKSCYAQSPSGEPKFTNYTADYIGVLDYIFVTSDNCVPLEILNPLTEEEVISRNVALPNPYNCSDHIPLFASIMIKK